MGKITDWLLVVATAFLAVFTGLLAYFTLQLAAVALNQTQVLKKTDEALHQSAEATTKAAIAAEKSAEAADSANRLNTAGLRPWISFETANLASDVVIDRENVTVPLIYTLKNTGHSPSVATEEAFDMVPLSSPPLDVDIVGRQRELCRTGAEKKTGATIFPDQTMPGQRIVQKPAADFVHKAERGEQVISILIIGCAGYQTAITSSDYHHTGLSLIISMAGKSKERREPIDVTRRTTLPRESLTFHRAPRDIAD